MRIRRIAILIDGGFFLKRLKKWPDIPTDDPKRVADCIRWMCKCHVQKLIHEKPGARTQSGWLDHVYRLFYYDAEPYDGAPHHPLLNRQVNFAATKEAEFRWALFDEIRRKRKFALRLGSLKKDGDWVPHARHLKGLLQLHAIAPALKTMVENGTPILETEKSEVTKILERWVVLSPDDIKLPLRQKGVDMKIGLDIASMTLKRQIDTIILVTGDSDFIPAAKIARREGVEFILDPMWQSVDDELMEHIDGLQSGLEKPGSTSRISFSDEQEEG